MHITISISKSLTIFHISYSKNCCRIRLCKTILQMITSIMEASAHFGESDSQCGQRHLYNHLCFLQRWSANRITNCPDDPDRSQQRCAPNHECIYL